MSAKASSSALSAASGPTLDLYTIGIVAFGVVGVCLIGYSLLSGSNGKAPAVNRPIQAAQTAPMVAAASPVRLEPAAEAVAVSKPVDAKTVSAPSAAELAQKNAAFDRFFVPPAGCSSPPKAKESPDCGVRYGHARMDFERQWALGQLR
jgi:hypothetical protein